MRAAILNENGELTVQEAPVPVAGSEEMLIRTLACGLCGSDLFKLRNKLAPPGSILGHEIVAVVESCPRNYVSTFPIGSRLTVSNHIPCGRCAACLKGRISMCDHFKSSHFDPGGFAEYIRIPASHIPEGVIPVPDEVTDEQAVFVEPIGCCLRALERWNPQGGQHIIILGLGVIGILMALLVRWMGAVPIGVDPLESRRTLGLSKGCEHTLSPDEAGSLLPAQGVVLTACNPPAMKTALRLVQPAGWIGLFSGPVRDVPIPCDLQMLYRNEIDLVPSYSTGPSHMRQAMNLLASRTFVLEDLISQRLSIEQIRIAVEMAEQKEGMKSILYF